MIHTTLVNLDSFCTNLLCFTPYVVYNNQFGLKKKKIMQNCGSKSKMLF